MTDLTATQARTTTGPLVAVGAVVVVDDRRFGAGTGESLTFEEAPWPVQVVRTGGRGPAAARNAGWRSVCSTWVVFLDDDVEVERGWMADLHEDLSTLDGDVGGVQGRIVVPLPGPETTRTEVGSRVPSTSVSLPDTGIRADASSTIEAASSRTLGASFTGVTTTDTSAVSHRATRSQTW